MRNNLIAIGRVRSVTPGRRLLRVIPADGAERYFANADWMNIAVRGSAAPIRCKVAAVREENGQYVVELAAGVTRDMVAHMKGAEVTVESQDEKRRVVGDYAGFAVFDETGTALGTVARVISGPGQDVIEIRKPGGGTILTPVIEQVVSNVDWDAGAMTLRDIAPYAVEDRADAD